jgi:hypothetical protein
VEEKDYTKMGKIHKERGLREMVLNGVNKQQRRKLQCSKQM